MTNNDNLLVLLSSLFFEVLCFYVVLVLGIPRYSFDAFSAPFRSAAEKPRAFQVEGTDRSGAGLSTEIRPRVAIFLGSENPETLRIGGFKHDPQ
jgi:hypothetical protein